MFRIKGTHFQENPIDSPSPPTLHDAPTQPSLRRPAPLAVLLAKARFSFTTASPIDQAALLGVVSIWVVVFLVGAMIAGMLSYDLFFTGKDVAPPRQVAPNPNSVAPLVHIGIDPLLTGTPAAQPQATPTRRTLFLVVPTPAK